MFAAKDNIEKNQTLSTFIAFFLLKYQKHVNVTAILCFVETWVVYEQEMAFMESPHPTPRKMGGAILLGLRGLKFSPTPGGT